jgi:hypothetical protein
MDGGWEQSGFVKGLPRNTVIRAYPSINRGVDFW